MITYALAAKLFESFSILRWNDRLRPVELIEIDHHALKSMLTYFLGKTAEHLPQPKAKIDWRRVVDENIMELLSRISTSDIQSAVRERLKEEDAFINMIISDWKKPSLKLNEKTLGLLESYLSGKRGDSVEDQIVRFSHKYITKREFRVISKFSLLDSDIKQIENGLNIDLQESIHASYEKEAKSLLDEKTSDWLPIIIDIAERLRYQTRWSQTPRIPQTSVLGHSMYCATLAYFMSIEAKLSDERIVSNFYAALFHDLPEALSRDIISPVKKADESIEKLIEKIEKELCEEEIFSRIPADWRKHFRFVTGQMCPNDEHLQDEQLVVRDKYWIGVQRNEFFARREFSNRLLRNEDKYIIVPWGDDDGDPFEEPMEGYRQEKGIDGKLLKICDNLAAFMEARQSLQHGIRSPHLDNGISSTTIACRGKRIYNLQVDEFFESITF